MAYFSFLFSFRGRLNRARFLVVQLALLAFWFTLPKFVVDFSPQWEAWVVVTAMIWISMATTARRLHDRGRNGWWAVAVLFVNHLAYAYYGLFFGLTFGVDISIVKELLLVMLAIASRCCKPGPSSSCFSWSGPMDPTGSGRIRPAALRILRSFRARHQPAFQIFSCSVQARCRAVDTWKP